MHLCSAWLCVGARREWAMPCRAELSQPSQVGRALARCPWLLQEHRPPASTCLTGDPADPSPQCCPCLVSCRAGSALGGCLWWQTHQLCPLRPPHQSPPHSSHVWAAPHQSPSPSHLCLHQTSLLLATFPHISGCFCSPSACPVHHNGDTFNEHPPFTHLTARRGVKPPG